MFQDISKNKLHYASFWWNNNKKKFPIIYACPLNPNIKNIYSTIIANSGGAWSPALPVGRLYAFFHSVII